LYPDGSFRSQGAYLGTNARGDTIYSDLGRWTHDSAGTRIQLHARADSPNRFVVEADGALRMLDMQGRTIESEANYSLAPLPDAVDITHPARLAGAFTYMADAANFVECASGLMFAVDNSGEYLTLERAYTSSAAAGAPMIVRVKAHLVERQAMEGEGPARALVIDSVGTIDERDGCAAQRTLDTIAAREWVLASISVDTGTLVVPENVPATFAWNREAGRLAGNAGCNSFTARATFRGTSLVGAPAAATKKFCNEPVAMAVEQRMLHLLSEGVSMRLDEDTLVWSAGPADVARFSARP
jgi:copper homeostasis protein (lipoprotein)